MTYMGVCMCVCERTVDIKSAHSLAECISTEMSCAVSTAMNMQVHKENCGTEGAREDYPERNMVEDKRDSRRGCHLR